MKTKRSPLVLSAVVAAALAVTPALASDAEKKQPLKVGEQAVDFSLPVVGTDQQEGQDQVVKLSAQYADGPVVLVVLRGFPGYQCPACTRQVGTLVNHAETLGEQAKRVILVYPGEPKLLERHAQDFLSWPTLPEPLVMVRDEGMEMVSDWGLRWEAPQETAYPATYVIDKSGKIRWSKISDSHHGRSTPQEILKALKNL